MKALSLYQPWASLIAYGIKRFETRSWAPPEALVGQRIAIHAGKKLPMEACDQLEVSEEVRTQMYRALHGRKALILWGDLPRGAIVCTAVLRAAFMRLPIGDAGPWPGGDPNAPINPSGSPREAWQGYGPIASVGWQADVYGDYSFGRWIWALTDVERLERPLAVRGRQGLFHVEI